MFALDRLKTGYCVFMSAGKENTIIFYDKLDPLVKALIVSCIVRFLGTENINFR